VKAVLVDVPESLLEERRRTGADVWDELWDGELHMVPPPSGLHQRLGGELFAVLLPLAKAVGLVGSYETGLYRPGTDVDYRVPDHVYARPELATERGVDGPAEVVVELLSPGDETYDKLDFYTEVGVDEVLVVHPVERRVELFLLRGERHVLVQTDAQGQVRSAALGAAFTTIAGPRLAVSWEGGTAEI
jgi:Uma2 family endonuclease